MTPEEIEHADAACRQWWLSVLTLGLIPKPEPEPEARDHVTEPDPVADLAAQLEELRGQLARSQGEIRVLRDRLEDSTGQTVNLLVEVKRLRGELAEAIEKRQLKPPPAPWWGVDQEQGEAMLAELRGWVGRLALARHYPGLRDAPAARAGRRHMEAVWELSALRAEHERIFADPDNGDLQGLLAFHDRWLPGALGPPGRRAGRLQGRPLPAGPPASPDRTRRPRRASPAPGPFACPDSPDRAARSPLPCPCPALGARLPRLPPASASACGLGLGLEPRAAARRRARSWPRPAPLARRASSASIWADSSSICRPMCCEVLVDLARTSRHCRRPPARRRLPVPAPGPALLRVTDDLVKLLPELRLAHGLWLRFRFRLRLRRHVLPALRLGHHPAELLPELRLGQGLRLRFRFRPGLRLWRHPLASLRLGDHLV